MKIHVKKSITIIFVFITGIWVFLVSALVHTAPLVVVTLLAIGAIFWIILLKKILIIAKIEISQDKIIIVTPKLFNIAAYRNFTLEQYEFPLAEITSVLLKRIQKQNESRSVGRGQLCIIINTSGGEYEIPVDAFGYNALTVLLRTIPGKFKE